MGSLSSKVEIGKAGNNKRAVRRHHRERIKGRIETVLVPLGFVPREQVCKHINTRTHCSCWLCGNPRKYYGQRTRQEVLARSRQAQMVEEIAQKGQSPLHV